jgi:hypothetical protein
VPEEDVELRLRAVELSGRGWKPTAIGRELGRSREWVRKWLGRFEVDGEVWRRCWRCRCGHIRYTDAFKHRRTPAITSTTEQARGAFGGKGRPRVEAEAMAVCFLSARESLRWMSTTLPGGSVRGRVWVLGFGGHSVDNGDGSSWVQSL